MNPIPELVPLSETTAPLRHPRLRSTRASAGPRAGELTYTEFVACMKRRRPPPRKKVHCACAGRLPRQQDARRSTSSALAAAQPHPRPRTRRRPLPVEGGCPYSSSGRAVPANRASPRRWRAGHPPGCRCAVHHLCAVGDYHERRPRYRCLRRKLTSLARIPLLVIDDFGLKPLRPPADEDLTT